MNKLEKLLQRPDGSEVKLVAYACFGAGLKCSIGVYVLVRESACHDWRVANDRPHPDWRKMSVSEYILRGRPEKFQLASHGEILKVAQQLRQLMNGTPAPAQ